MTDKPLSEQVALLEDSRDFYRSARNELIDDNETLKAERDDLQRQANEARDEHHKFTAALGFGDGVTDPSATYDDMLEPMQRAMQDSLEHNECPIICEMCGEWLANTACEHCHGSGCDSSRSRSAMAYVECEWCGGAGKIHPGCAEKSYSDLVAEVDELRAKLDRATDDMEAHLEADSIVDAENEAVAVTTVPRVISVDELREGQLICIHRGQSWGVRAIGEFRGIEDDVVTIKTGGSGTFTESVKFHTIVLLEDVPELERQGHDTCCRSSRATPEPVTAEAIRASDPGGTWRDIRGDVFEWDGEYLREHMGDGFGVKRSPELPNDLTGRSTASPRGDYSTPPRLTVHQLNVAPVGSVAARFGNRFCRKGRDGTWWRSGVNWTSEELIAAGWADATLTYPGSP